MAASDNVPILLKNRLHLAGRPQMSTRPYILGTRCHAAPTTGGGCCTVSAFPQSIVLRCRVALPFAELRQMLLVDAINLGLHLGMPALDEDGEFADQSARAKPFK